MSGTKEGGLKAAAANKEKYGADFYAKIGAKGGVLGKTGGFAKKAQCYCDIFSVGHTVAMCAGRKGGKVSRRGKAKEEA